MSDDPRKELAELSRSVRRSLERERAAGLGELLVSAASRARGTGAFAAAGEPSAPLYETTTVEVLTTVSDEPDDLEPDGRSLFEEATEALPAFHPPLHPWGIEARAAIAKTAEPLLAAIAEEVKVCEKCALSKLRTLAVPGVGSAKSGIVFVGEGPGADEDRLGEPFVGRAGQLLDRIILAMDEAKLIPGVPLNRGTVFIGNIVHCRPPENRVPLPHEVEMSSPYLLRQIDAIKPRIICCLGKTAAELLLGMKGALGGMRGKVYRFHGAKLIVTYHPAACLRNPGYKRPVWEDMQLLAREYQAD